MAHRLFSQTQTLIRTTNPSQSLKLTLSQHNRYSTHSPKPQSIDTDLESETEHELLGLRKLEDAIHSIIVRQSKPDWLPFVPGSSYWVPPRRHRRHSHGIVGLLRNFNKPVMADQSMSVGSVRGWPSSAYFIGGLWHYLCGRLNANKICERRHYIHINQASISWFSEAPSRSVMCYINMYICTSTMHPVPIELEAEEVHSDEENTHDVKIQE